MMKRLVLILISFFVLSIAGAGLLLKKGIQIDNLEITPVTLTNISLKWHSKLELQIESLSRKTTKDTSDKQPLNLSGIEKIIPLLQWVDWLFVKISVQEIRVGEVEGNFLYASSVGHFNLFSRLLDLHSSFKVDEGELVVTINDLSSEEFQFQAVGAIRFDLVSKTGRGQLNVNFADALPVNLTFVADQHQLSFEGKENGTITTITPFVDLFGLSENIQRWITAYLTGSRYVLKTLKGDFPWDNPLHLLESFYAEVRVENCQYTFATGLEAIKTDYTDVTFKQGVLGIVPHDSTFYGQDAEDSWLDINFNDFDDIILTAYILTSAVVNKDIINLLAYYDIPFPFLQVKGKTKTDLVLAINLASGEVTATGSFLIKESVIEHEKTPYQVKRAEINLKNSYVSLKKIELEYGDILQADVSGFIDATSTKGDIDIALHNLVIPMGDSVVKLDTSKAPLKLRYQIRTDGARVEGGKSSWHLNEMSISLEAFSTPLTANDYSGVLPPVQISITDDSKAAALRAELSGTFTVKKKQVDLHGVLQECSLKGLTLKSGSTPIRISYKDDGLLVEHTGQSQWDFEQVAIELYKSKGFFQNNIHSLTIDKLKYGDYFEGGIDGSYDTALQKGEYSISKPLLGRKGMKQIVTPEDLTLQLDGSAQHLQIIVPELDLTVSTGDNNQWSAHISDLKSIHKRSPLLQQFKLDSGNVTVSSAGGGAPYVFWADIPWHYPLLVHDNKPITQYAITGAVRNGSVQAEINHKVNLHYAERLLISSEQISYNIPEISRFFKECIQIRDDKKEKGDALSISFTAIDSGLYLSPQSQIIAENVTLSSVNNKVEMELFSGPGKIVISMEGENFSLHGEDLDDTFMGALSPDAHLRHGKMTVGAKGKFDNFLVLIEVEKAILEDLKTLNNILAFVNTVPALITFNLPGYSSDGLHVSSAVVGANVVDGIASIESMSVEALELSITGEGWINFPEKTVEMDLNLITQAKKNMNKIPLVGYILTGKEKHPSITVTVSGDLANPEVEHRTFKEVATIPFGILYRTLALPAHIVSPLLEKEDVALPESSDFEME